jgi:hypothetical protein
MTPMHRTRKILFFLISLAAFFLCLLILVMIVTPHLINLDTVQEKIKEEYATATGGEIEYRRIDLEFFPSPHIAVYEVAIKYMDKVSGTIESLKVYPKILPLLIGELQVGTVDFRSPEINIQLPQEEAADEGQLSTPFSFETLPEQLHAVLATISEFKIPSMVTRIRNGQIYFLRGNKRFLGLQGLNGQIKRREDTFEFRAECQSNFWENVSMEGRYEEPGFKLESQIRLSQLRPHAVVDYFFPQSNLKMTNARVNLTLDLHTDGLKQLRANLQGSIPYMYWRRGNTEWKFTDTRFQGGFQINDRSITLTLSQFDLKDPRLSLAGRLKVDPAQSDIQLELEGRQINVSNTAKIAMALTDNDQTLSEIVKILREGDIQWMTLKVQGSDWTQLADFNRFVIQGSIVGGELFIPGVQLNLLDVQGQATIANSILHGENVEARMGNSTGSKGKVAIALTGAKAPLHIEGLIQADLSQLPPVLNRLIDNTELKKELALIEKLEGSAVGTLIIGEDTEDPNVRVMASDIKLSARYQRIPFPMNINGGNLLLDGTRIALTNFNATVGNCTFAQLSSKFSWVKTSFLELSSKSANIDLAQLYAGLAKNGAFEAVLRKIETINGMVSLQNVKLKGPLLKPDQWQIQSDGEVQNIGLSMPLLPGKLTVAKARFICEGHHLNVPNLSALVGQSSFSAFSADLQWGEVLTLSANSQQSVIFLDEVFPWLQSQPALRQHLKQLQALSGTLAFQNLAFNGQLAGKIKSEFSLDGAIQKWDVYSPKFPTHIELAGGNLSWHSNQIALLETNANFGVSAVNRLSLQQQWGDKPSVEFKAVSADIRIAELYSWLVSFEALEKMFRGYVATQGRLTLNGFDFKGPLSRSEEWQFQLSGDLQDLTLEADDFKAPIYIDTAKFSASDLPGAASVQGRIDINETLIRWEDSQLTVQGMAAFATDELRLEMQLAADRLRWGQIDQIIELGKRMEPGSKMALSGSLKVESENFSYDGYTWQPVHADISFNETETRIVIKKADLCGIQFPGIVKISANDLEMHFNPLAENQSLGPSVDCLSAKKNLASGNFNFIGELISKANPHEFPKSLTGNLEFTATEGRIYRFGILAKILALLNVTEIWRGEVPDLTGKGFGYNSIVANGIFENGKLVIKESSIDSPSMGIAIEGEIDLIQKKMNLVVLVAPFKTVDRIVKHIPLVGTVLGGNLISIPFRAVGDVGDPDVIPLSPTAVGSGLLGMLERTLKLPITIIQPVLPGSKDKKKGKEADRTDF